MKRIHALISGRVQGVMFRDYTARKAKNLGIYGTVVNNSDGTVKVTAEGNENALKKFISFLEKGPLLAKVEKVDVIWQEGTNEFEDFKIIYRDFLDHF